jgi:hypothetical protein
MCRPHSVSPRSLLLAAVMLVLETQYVHGQVFLRGDGNSDGRVDMFDAVYINCYVFLGGFPVGCEDAGDANDDGSINVSDVVFLLNWYPGGGPAPPAPGPVTCGIDPSPDPLPCLTPPPCAPQPVPSVSGVTFQLVQTTTPAVTPTDSWGCSEVMAQINNTNPNFDVAAWSMSIKTSGNCRILEATTAGTVVPTLIKSGFQKSEATRCGNGAVSSVILSGNQQVALGVGTHNVLSLKTAVKKIPNITPKLAFVNGQQCQGNPPVRNFVTECGEARTPTVLSLTLTPPAGTATFNTLPGSKVDVCLRPNVWVNFDTVSTPMITTAQMLPPANFKVGGAFAWKLGPTGNYPPGVTVNFRYPCNWTLAQKLAAQLFHKPGGVGPWNLVSTTNNTCTSVLTGVVPGFSDFSVALPPELVPFRRADANSDKRVDIADGIMILGCMFLGTACPTCPDASDVNDDSMVDIADALSIFNYQFLGGSEPAPPGPLEPGLDPTEDDLEPCSYPAELDDEGIEEEPDTET